MDLGAFADWLLTDYRSKNHNGALRASTVEDTLRKMRHLASRGLDWDVFTADPVQARLVAAPVLAEKARHPKRGYGLRDYQKVLNRVVRWKAATDKAWKDVVWELAREPKGLGPMQEAQEVELLSHYRGGRDEYERRRHRCILWLIRNTRFRRGEVASLSVADLRPNYRDGWGAILLHHPEKWGHARPIPVPASAWDAEGPLQKYLDVRRADPRNRAALLTRQDGETYRAMSAVDMGVDLERISKACGFRVSFNRLRRYEYTAMKRAKVDPWVMLYLHGGSGFNVLERYLGPLTPDEAQEELAAKLGGF